MTTENQRAACLGVASGDPFRRSDATNASALKNEVIGAADKGQLKDTAIPAEWILEGSPKTRIKVLSDGSLDGSAFTIMWDCTAGRFNWFYNIDETVFILEGAVTLKLPSGATHRLVAGSTYYFAYGTQAEWQVDQYIRKVAWCHSPMPAPLRAAKRIVKSLKRAIKGGPKDSGPAAMFGAS